MTTNPTLESALAPGLTKEERVDLFANACGVNRTVNQARDILVQLLDAHARDAREQQRKEDLAFFLDRLKEAEIYWEDNHFNLSGVCHEIVNHIVEHLPKEKA